MEPSTTLVYKGTWEEVKLHDAELAGKWVTLVILDDEVPKTTEIEKHRQSSDNEEIS